MEREVGGGTGMGNTCKPLAVSFPYSDLLSLKRKKKFFFLSFLKCPRGFPGGSVVKNPAANAGRHRFDP